MIRNQARTFAVIIPGSDDYSTLSPNWIDAFKSRNSLKGTNSRNRSLSPGNAPPTLDSLVKTAVDGSVDLDEAVDTILANGSPSTVASPRNVMGPAVRPTHAFAVETNCDPVPALSKNLESFTRPEEAQQAWKVLMKFLHEQHGRFEVQDFVQMGKLIVKLDVLSKSLT